MGNRAYVVFKDDNSISPAVYLHWNGGPESVYQFLSELNKRYGRWHDADYRAAKFVQVVGDFFDSNSFEGLSLGITNTPDGMSFEEKLLWLANCASDNGVYVVGPSGVIDHCIGKGFDEKDFRYTQLFHKTKRALQKEMADANKSEYSSEKDGIPATFSDIRGAFKLIQTKHV